MLPREYFVYIMTNATGNVLYVGVTNDVAKRGDEHASGFAESSHRDTN